SRGRLIADLRRHHKQKRGLPPPVPQPDEDSLIVPAAYRDVQAGRNLHIRVSLLASTSPASFSPDARIVSAYEQGQAQSLLLVDTSSGKTLRTLHLPVAGVLRTRFSLDSKTLATVSRAAPWVKRDRLRLWDVPSGKALPVTLDGAVVQAIAFAPDGRTVAVSTDDMLYVFDNATGRQRHAAKLASPVDDLALPSLGGPTALSNTIAFSPNGKLLAVAASMGQVRLWDMGTGKEILPSPDSHREPVRAVAVSPDGKRIASASTDGTLRVWDFQTGRRVQTLPLPGSADAPGPVPWDGFTRYAVVFSRDGKLIAASSPFATVRVWDAATGQQRQQIAVWPGGVNSLAITPDGQTLITGGYGRLLAWDVQTGKLTQTIANPPPAALEQGPLPFTTPTWKVAVSPDGRLVAGTSSLPGHDRERSPSGFQLRIWERETGRLRRCLPLPRTGSPVVIGRDTRSGKFDLNESDTQLCFAPDGKSLVWNDDGGLALLDVIHGNTLRSIGGSAANLRGIAFSPTGRLVATVSTTGRLRLYDPATGTVVGQARTLRGDLSCVAFSPDGKTLVTGGSDATILVWDVGMLLGACHLGPHAVSAGTLERWWQQLAHADANEMAMAMANLEDRPEQAVAWIHEHLRPAAAPGRARLSRLVAALDDARFAVRVRATRELESLAEQAGPFLRQRLAERPSPEMRRRLTALLQHLNGPVRLPAQMRVLRGIEILEQIGTPKACAELRDLAGGDGNARLTDEAKAALERLHRTK
ncbi:MAG TPA: WD40 repeat domain-containing protein, partial [Gemmataceae bacterium]|nr:WD40 repeat domain-containing protein [Gemmataceae bacterium]